MTETVRGLLQIIAAALVSVCCGAVLAQSYPSKPIRVVIPYSPGGPGEFSFRAISQALETRLGQRFVLDHKAGASGNIGAAEVARAAPDGYTLLLGATNNFVSNQFLYRNMGFDPLEALAPVAILSNSPTVFAANATLPFRSLPEMVAYAKANPGKLNYGSPGNATPPHLAGELLSRLAAIQMVHVPFKGAGLVIPSVLANEVQFYFATLPSVAAHMKSGRMRALAVGSPARLEAITEVPTTGEAGYPELVTGNWWLVAAPRDTESRIIDRLASEIRQSLSEASVKQRFTELGMVAIAQSPSELRQMLQVEAARWKKIIEAAGVVAE